VLEAFERSYATALPRYSERTQGLQVELPDAPDAMGCHEGAKMLKDLLVFLDGRVAQLASLCIEEEQLYRPLQGYGPQI
jgi:hypothetical protein